MHGRTETVVIAILIISLIGAATDIWRGKIYNWLTLPALLAGLLHSGITGGWSGLGHALLAVLAGLLLYGWMFWIHAMGAGDVKFLMALSAWGGLQYALQTGILGILLGGAMALAILVARGRILDFSRRLYRFLLSIMVRELVAEAPRIDRKHKMPFGVPIALAASWIVLSNPFEKWGIWIWR